MITTSLITSQMSITPAKAVTSRSMRASCLSSMVLSSYCISQSAQAVCQHSGWPFTRRPRSTRKREAFMRLSVWGSPSFGSKPPQ